MLETTRGNSVRPSRLASAVSPYTRLHRRHTARPVQSDFTRLRNTLPFGPNPGTFLESYTGAGSLAHPSPRAGQPPLVTSPLHRVLRGRTHPTDVIFWKSEDSGVLTSRRFSSTPIVMFTPLASSSFDSSRRDRFCTNSSSPCNTNKSAAGGMIHRMSSAATSENTASDKGLF